MILKNPNGETRFSEPEFHSFQNNEILNDYSLDEFDSNCSTPYVSAPSSPGSTAPNNGYFFSAPASPMHYVISSSHSTNVISSDPSASGSLDFEFSSKFSSSCLETGSMSSADELFCNGRIRPVVKLSSHLQRPQMLAPLLDLEFQEECIEELKCDESVMRGRDLRLRNRSLNRRARSMSPIRNSQQILADREVAADFDYVDGNSENAGIQLQMPLTETPPTDSASSSRSSSSGRNSRKWIFFKELLYRSKSEGRATGKEKFWSSISFSPAKEKSSSTSTSSPVAGETLNQKRKKQFTSTISSTVKPMNGVAKRRTVPPSPHEIHYTAKRAQAEEMKKKTYLPYRKGLFGYLGFSSKGYGADSSR